MPKYLERTSGKFGSYMTKLHLVKARGGPVQSQHVCQYNIYKHEHIKNSLLRQHVIKIVQIMASKDLDKSSIYKKNEL